MLGVIYCFHCISNGKKYIGATEKGLDHRVKQHLNNVKRNYKTCRKFYNSIRKYGIENFIIGIIEECDANDIFEKEKFYIQKYDTYKNGLNSTLGGEGVSGWKHNEKTRKLIKEKRKTQIITEKTKQKLRGKKHTEEWKRKHIERMSGRVVTQETRNKIRKKLKGRKGKPHTEERKKQISQQFKGIPLKEEHIEKIKASKKGAKYWNDGVKNRVSKECPGEGWVLGRVQKAGYPLPGRRGAKWWNNGIENKCCKECPGEGWVKGMFKK